MYRQEKKKSNNKLNSKEADLYLDYLEQKLQAQKNIVLVRERRLHLSYKESKDMLERFTSMIIPPLRAQFDIYTDGYFVEYFSDGREEDCS